jgi:predicted PurR-regulated permease PerM
VTFYLVADGPRARQVLARPLPPDRQREMLAIWELAVAKTGGYLYSRVVLATAAAVTTTGFLFAIGVPYPIPLGILVGTTSVFIPVIGTYLGGVLVLLVAFVDQAGRGERPTDVLWVAGFLIVYQQIENYIFAPRIQARTMDVHPAVAFVSVLVGGTLLGAVGALLALPAAAILQALLSTYVRRHQLISELQEVHLPEDKRAPQEPRPVLPLRRRKGQAEA